MQSRREQLLLAAVLALTRANRCEGGLKNYSVDITIKVEEPAHFKWGLFSSLCLVFISKHICYTSLKPSNLSSAASVSM